MVSRKDAFNVLKGLEIVIEKFIEKNRPDLNEKFVRAQFHAKELFTILVDIKNDKLKTNNDMENYPCDTIRKESEVLVTNSMIKSDFEEQSSNYPVISSFTIPNEPSDERNHKFKENRSVDFLGFNLIDVDKSSTENWRKNDDVSMMKERKVPATQIGRMFGFGSTAIQMTLGHILEKASSSGTVESNEKKDIISEKNAELLAETLCRMRGASLKLGQMLTLQDEDLLSPALSKALERVKQSADYMPRKQLERQLSSQLSTNWQDNFSEFSFIPMAAASIGQVHRARLPDGSAVAVKVQYPGVAQSIRSDLNNLKRLLQVLNVFPKGLFLPQIMQVAETELAKECDYTIEAASQLRYRELVLADPLLSQHVAVPRIYSDLSGQQVLTSAFANGHNIDSEQVRELPQEARNAIARTLMLLTFKEVFEWRFIQSDPNFSNFLYDHSSLTLNLVDFGAAREYSKSFIDDYMLLVWAAANEDRDQLLEVSKRLGFISGEESPQMLSAHVSAGLVVGEPFRSTDAFDFASSKLSSRLAQYGDTFLKYRLVAPPVEVYTLHRKLAGAFSICIKLRATISCRDILEAVYRDYSFPEAPPSGPVSESN